MFKIINHPFVQNLVIIMKKEDEKKMKKELNILKENWIMLIGHMTKIVRHHQKKKQQEKEVI